MTADPWPVLDRIEADTTGQLWAVWRTRRGEDRRACTPDQADRLRRRAQMLGDPTPKEAA